jgi:hypothetical protein
MESGSRNMADREDSTCDVEPAGGCTCALVLEGIDTATSSRWTQMRTCCEHVRTSLCRQKTTAQCKDTAAEDADDADKSHDGSLCPYDQREDIGH